MVWKQNGPSSNPPRRNVGGDLRSRRSSIDLASRTWPNRLSASPYQCICLTSPARNKVGAELISLDRASRTVKSRHSLRNVAGKRGLKQWHASREAYLLSVCAIRSRRHLRTY
ncbi:hypothetical protein AGROH133_14149 (plasmid) [Agrobacterium tumefaciens]|nr:hypothetical protein AGROH133_14149 [Agrobacterium tumefaciens]